MLTRIILSFFLLLNLHSDALGQGIYYHVGDSLTVAAKSGIKLRDSASLNANTIKVIPFGSKVMMKGLPQSWDMIENRPGSWSEVAYKNYTGFVFTGYLTHLKIPELPKAHDVTSGHDPCQNLGWFEDVARLNADTLLVKRDTQYGGFDIDKGGLHSIWEIYADETEIYHVYSYETHHLVIETRQISMEDILNLLEYFAGKFESTCKYDWHIKEGDHLPIKVETNPYQITRISCQQLDFIAEQSLNKIQIRLFLEGS